MDSKVPEVPVGGVLGMEVPEDGVTPCLGILIPVDPHFEGFLRCNGISPDFHIPESEHGTCPRCKMGLAPNDEMLRHHNSVVPECNYCGHVELGALPADPTAYGIEPGKKRRYKADTFQCQCERCDTLFRSYRPYARWCLVCRPGMVDKWYKQRRREEAKRKKEEK